MQTSYSLKAIKTKLVTLFLLLFFLLPFIGTSQCALEVDCSSIVDQQLACRFDLPAVDFDLPIVVDSCGNIALSALTIIPNNSACPNDTLFVQRTYFIQDSEGNLEQCMQLFTIVDDIAPMMLCQSITLELDASGMASIVPSDVDAGSTANCGSAVSLSLSQSDFTCADVGDVDVWLIGEDACGNLDSCIAVVTIVDNVDPIITCPADITMNADPDRCTAVVCFNIGVTDNCEAILPEDISDFDFLGTFENHNYFVSSETNLLGWEEANAAAAAAGGHLVVITSDLEQEFIADNVDDGLYRIGLRYSPRLDEFKWVNGEPFVFDAWGIGQPGGVLEGDYVFNLDIGGSIVDGWYDAPSILPLRYIIEIETYNTELTAGLPAGSNFPVGITEVTYVASDAAGNTAECSFNVRVFDIQSPVINCPSDTILQLEPEECEILFTFDDPEFTDNCPDAVITQIDGLASGSLFPIGENIISFEARDTSGNVDTCTWLVIVNDYEPNGLLCKGVINFSIDETACSGELLPGMLIDVSAVGCADSCTITVKGEDGIKRPAIFSTNDIGKSYEYEICCGGICCWGIVNVEYKFDPIIDCVMNDTLSCTQAFSEATVPSVSSNCAPSTLTLIAEEFEMLECNEFFTSSMTRSWIAIDSFGNTSDTCTQTVFLERTDLDNIIPVQNFMIANDAALDCGSGYATIGNTIFPALSVTGAPKLLVDGEIVDIFPFDAATICNGFAEFDDQILPGSSSCVTKILRTFTIGEWYCGGTNEREFIQLIEIEDFTGPTITCPGDVTVSASTFECESMAIFTLPTASDVCNDDIRIDLESPSGFIANYNGQQVMLPVGVHTLTYNAYDGCNNLTQCSFDVTVQDNADPIAICDQFTEISLSLESTTYITASAIDDGSFDECGPVTLTIARMDDLGFGDFTGFEETAPIFCADAGTDVMVGLLVTDAGGNTNMCMVAVSVKDKVDAKMICPGPMTVECNFAYDEDNLSAFFGGVEILDNCPEENSISEKLVGELTSCGNGVLVREITLRNAQGVPVDFCTQTITFESGSPLTFGDIIPPPSEVEVNGCGIGAVDPTTLGMPIIPDGVCQLVSIAVDNDTFPFTQNGACLKILRTFKVIDMCITDGAGSIFDPFEFTQTIKVSNDVAPTFTDVFEDSTYCSFAVDCGGLTISGLTAQSSDDCTIASQVSRKYETRNADGDLVRAGLGHDASGYYDLGSYTVRFIAEDRCGNQNITEQTFAIVSCKQPVAYCLDGLSTTLTAMDTDGDGTADAEQVMITPSFFDAGSYHPCGLPITLSFSADINDTLAVFFCSDTVGIIDVELWATVIDADGNAVPEMSSFCVASLDVQNNEDIDLCAGMRPADIAGRIYTTQSAELTDATVELISAELLIDMTDAAGEYAFLDMPMGGAYTVHPVKDDDVLNGVSTLDLVMIQRHLLGIQTFDDVHQYIAADINNDERLNPSDLLALRKAILGITTQFPNNTSWRFIDEAHEWTDETDPWDTEFAEAYDITNLESDMWIDFIAVKTGDINGNVSTNVKAGLVTETRSNKTLMLDLPDTRVVSGEIYNVDVNATVAMNIRGLQQAYRLDGVEVLEVLSGACNLTAKDIHVVDNTLKISYANAVGDYIQPGTSVYTIVIRALEDGALSEMIGADDGAIRPEVYIGEALTVGDIEIDWRADNTVAPVAHLVAGTITPNPWRSQTKINFDLPTAGTVSLIIRDASGRLLYEIEGNFGTGAQSFTVTEEHIQTTGLLLYDLRFGDQVVHKKMIRVD